ncbi:MAG: GAF domain-containing protein [Deltaproteobacteria bacterium]|nr:GAF domain-containing protein [Deltaproteobacteria bacterium]
MQDRDTNGKPSLHGAGSVFEDPETGTSLAKQTFLKPEVPDSVIKQWQGIVDLMALVCNVPAGLIMKVHESEIEVLVSARVANNPYHPGEMVSLNTGLYCETVMSCKERLLVPNALTDPNWDHNPDIRFGMISYLGYPLVWPDGEVFGTICILDNVENSYSAKVDEYLKLFRANVENYLALLFEIDERERNTKERERLILELQDALAQVKKLSGFLPICASCKKIRDDKGYWHQVEKYVRDHSEAEFSHGICPECMKKLYPEFAD